MVGAIVECEAGGELQEINGRGELIGMSGQKVLRVSRLACALKSTFS